MSGYDVLTRCCALWLISIVNAIPLQAQETGRAQDGSSLPAQLSTAGAEEEGAGEETEAAGQSGGLGALDALLDADITQLARTEIVAPVFSEAVTTVAREKSTVGRSAAAVYVITNEMIRRSGARSIPEALRLAPGVEVAKIDSNKWAVSIRGFNQRFANKLLVQIDGRSVYTPLFAGVFWDVQDVLLEDVERIEVVRGPGATVWGANAVNGVINIITKDTADTTGIYTEAGGGTERLFGSARVGGNVANGSWRLWTKWFERDEAFLPSGRARDDWDISRIGFRSDWRLDSCDTMTFQGNYYNGEAGQFRVLPQPSFPFIAPTAEDKRLAGGYGLWRWSRDLGGDSDWSLQVYYDRTERTFEADGQREDRDTVDIDYQIRTPVGQRHSLIWGAGYRNSRDRLRNSPTTLSFLPEDRADDRFSLFLQDKMELSENKLYFIAGSKFSWNDYTGFEYQPNARVLLTPTNRQTIWASVSRAVRVPARADDDIQSFLLPSSTPFYPTFPKLVGNRGVSSEQLLAWELGMRAAPTETFFWDTALFFNQYEDLNTLRAGFPSVDPQTGMFNLPLQFFNGAEGESYGFELASTWQIRPDWSLRGAYSLIRVDLRSAPEAVPGTTAAENGSPHNQFFLHSSWDLGNAWEFDLMGRYKDRFHSVPSYFEMDTRLGWAASESVEVVLAGRNLLDSSHPEQPGDMFRGLVATETQRELYGMITWRY